MIETFRQATRRNTHVQEDKGRSRARRRPRQSLDQRHPGEQTELIDGQLIICDLQGSRRIAWQLLADHGPRSA